jgi:hypothetical protein
MPQHARARSDGRREESAAAADVEEISQVGKSQKSRSAPVRLTPVAEVLLDELPVS